MRLCLYYLRCVEQFDIICTILKREKHIWRSVTFNKVTLLKVTLLHVCFSRFLNGTNDSKPLNTSHLMLNLVFLRSIF